MTASPQTEAVRAIQAAVEAAGFEFHRGDYAWADHDYSQQPRVAYLMVMRGELEVDREHHPHRSAQVQLVLVEGQAGSSVVPSTLNDKLLDDLRDSAGWIFEQANLDTYDDGPPGSFKVAIDPSTAAVQEFHSVGFHIQGIAVSFEMQF